MILNAVNNLRSIVDTLVTLEVLQAMKGGEDMKITRTRRYEDTEVILKLGKDFSYRDLEKHGDGLLRLTESSGNRIASRIRFDLMEWCEAYNSKTKTIKVRFRKFL